MNKIISTIPNMGPKLPLCTINKGIIEDKKRNWTSSFCDSPRIEIADLLINIAKAIIIVKFAMFEPNALPTERPPSLPNEANIDTDSSGNEVDTESIIKPAAISESPRAFDKTREYLIILSLTRAIRNNETARTGMLIQIIFYLNCVISFFHVAESQL
jgi:hypothetical protein